MKFRVIMCSSSVQRLMPVYLESLRESGIPHHVETVQISSPSDGTMGWCIERWREMAERFIDEDRIIVTDAFDVISTGKERVVRKALEGMNPEPCFAAERNCYPEPNIAQKILYSGTPWNYVNGGMVTSGPREMIEWCDAVQNHPLYDAGMIAQGWLNRRLSEQSPLVKIDFNTRLFYCMYREDENPFLDVDKNGVVNRLNGNRPSFIHFNGSYPYYEFIERMECQKS